MSGLSSLVFPEEASTFAGRVDGLYLFLCLLSTVMTVLIVSVLIYFAIRYRRRSPDEVPDPVTGGDTLELAWTIAPLIVFLGIFVWGASLFFTMSRPPPDAMEIYVTGKQWMWKFQHLHGQREINELHVPVGRPVKLIMSSEDVIHSFFVPAFRTKMDVLPGRYTSLWFEATKAGSYHLFCTEYCGTKHSGMIGKVVVLEPAQYQAWLSGGAAEGSLAGQGQRLFQALACHTCHRADAQARGPALEGMFGKAVKLRDGSEVKVDEVYLRESILNPNAKVVAGFEPIMPTYEGQISEEGLVQLIAYMKSLGAAAPGGAGGAR